MNAACYLLLFFSELDFNCASDTVTCRHENVCNGLWLSNRCVMTATSTRRQGGEGAVCSFTGEQPGLGFCSRCDTCRVLPTLTFKSPRIWPCWSPALLNKLDPYIFGKQHNVQWKGRSVPRTMSGLCAIMNIISCCLILPMKDHLKLILVCHARCQGENVFNYFPLNARVWSWARLPFGACHQPAGRSSLEQPRYCLLFETSCTESYSSVLKLVIKNHGLGGSPRNQ